MIYVTAKSVHIHSRMNVKRFFAFYIGLYVSLTISH